MILKGAQRGGAGQLARHLLNDRDNDHVTLHELRGFLSGDLAGALDEMHAISKATHCRQFMFSLSLNPPKDMPCDIGALVKAADQAEERLGLQGQPRAIVVHEKAGRRHIHVVWSRIEAASMKAVALPFFKNRLATLSKELYLEHGWALPDGHRENGWKNPLNFTLAEWQQARRLGLDPRELKQLFQDAWMHSDGLKGFKAALEDRGYYLAKGDRRGYVAVDFMGEVYSVARMVGVKTKALEVKLGSPDHLPSVADTKGRMQGSLQGELRRRYLELRRGQAALVRPEFAALKALVKTQREERQKLEDAQVARLEQETRARQARFRRGVRGLWDILSGRAAQVRRLNEQECLEGYRRDMRQREWLFREQLDERRRHQQRIDELRARQRKDAMGFVRGTIALWSKGGHQHGQAIDHGISLYP